MSTTGGLRVVIDSVACYSRSPLESSIEKSINVTPGPWFFFNPSHVFITVTMTKLFNSLKDKLCITWSDHSCLQYRYPNVWKFIPLKKVLLWAIIEKEWPRSSHTDLSVISVLGARHDEFEYLWFSFWLHHADCSIVHRHSVISVLRPKVIL